MSIVQISRFANLPDTLVDQIESFTGEPEVIVRVCKSFNKNRYEATWSALFAAYNRNPFLRGIANRIDACFHHLPSKTRMKQYVSFVHMSVLSGAVHATRPRATSLPAGFCFYPAHFGKLDPARLATISEATGIIGFLRATGTPETTLDSLFSLLRLYPENERHLRSLALECSRWMVHHSPALRNHTQLGHIRSQELAGFRFTHIPPEVRLLPNLRTLEFCHRDETGRHDIRSYFLSDLPDEFKACIHLTHANLSGNSFKHFPAPLLACKRITKLHLSANLLSEVPRELAQLSALTELDLANNSSLANLPEEFWDLRALRALCFAGTALTHLSSRIGELKALTRLILNSCKLRRLPPEISSCTLLNCVALYDNPFDEMSSEEIRKILPWLREDYTQTVPPHLMIGLFLLHDPLKKAEEVKQEAVPAADESSAPKRQRTDGASSTTA